MFPVSCLLFLLTFSTIFERFNIFIVPLDFSLKLSLILLPLVGLILLYKKKLTFNPTILLPFLAAVIAVEAVSVPFSYDRFQSFQAIVLHILMVGLFYLITWAFVGVEPSIGSDPVGAVVRGWGAGALVVSLLGFWQFGRYLAGLSPTIFLDNLLGAKSLGAATFTQSFFGRIFLRPSSTFIDTNTAASFVGIAIILGLGFFLSSKERRDRIFLVAVLVASSAFFLLSSSRSAALGLAAGLIAFAVFNVWERFGKKAILTAAAVFFAFVVLSLGVITLLNQERLVSSLERLDYLRGAVMMIRHNPLLGVGAGNFERYYTEVIETGALFGFSHSILLTWLGETGILGLVANLSLIGAVLFLLGREAMRHRAGTEWRIRLSALFAAFSALVAANIFHAHYGLEFTWVLLGLCVLTYYVAKSERLKAKREKISVLGVGVDNVTMSEAMGRVKEFFKKGKKAAVFTPNPEMVMLAERDSSFRKVLNQADLSVPDGIGIVLASRILGTPLRERVAGADFFLELCAEAARRGGRVFLLGAGAGVAEKAARELRRRYPKLKIVGTFAGDGSPKGDAETISAIKRSVAINNQQSTISNIDLLFVAYGGGKEERWIARNLKRVSAKVAMGVGGTFDFVAGEVPRAPAAIRRLGFEWLYRLIRQPQRFRRQLTLIPFAAHVFRQSLRG